VKAEPSTKSEPLLDHTHSSLSSSGSGGKTQKRSAPYPIKQEGTKRVKAEPSLSHVRTPPSALPPLEQEHGTGVKRALCIGNDNYSTASGMRKLKNARNDAAAIWNRFQYLEFVDPEFECDIETQDDFKKIIDTFIATLRAHDTVIIFYAGHAAETPSGNALLACGTRPTEVIPDITLQYIHKRIEEARIGPLRALGFFIDGCRLADTRDPAPTLGDWRLPSIRNAFYSFACGPGQSAYDGDAKSRQGLYTSHLLEALKLPERDVVEIAREVCEKVCLASRNEQVPWYHESVVVHPFDIFA
jgi:hypothetical protein